MTFIIILIKLNIPHYFNLQNKDELRVLISFSHFSWESDRGELAGGGSGMVRKTCFANFYQPHDTNLLWTTLCCFCCCLDQIPTNHK